MSWVDRAVIAMSELEWSFPLLGWLSVFASLAASVHVVLRKRDSRAAISWMGLIWLSPFIGSFLYMVLGVNRIRRRAQAMRPRPAIAPPMREVLGENISIESAGLLRLGDVVTLTPTLPGNSVKPLHNGDEAYPEMLRAIASAKYSVTLGTYIFDHDAVGMQFLDALVEAQNRGVQVRVLIDDVGARYSKEKMHRVLKKRGIRVARFLPVFSPKSFFFLNLRLHRKILVVDGMVAFTGGMNIREAHEVRRNLPETVKDMHFEVRGPVVGDIQRVFSDDWEFTTGEVLKGGAWFPSLSEQGTVLARCVNDGPDLHLENARWMLLGAISSARDTIRIVTPYFVPDGGLITALNTAALRGIHVQIVLPENNNLPWVHWASIATLWQVVERGCEVFLSPGPFDHSKLMTVDGRWTFFGSVNWDARSLRLNFEMNIEAVDTELAQQMNTVIDEKIRVARLVTLKELDARPFSARLRDGFARLLSPYL